MPGPAFTTGESVSLHPIEPEDYEFIQRERQRESARVPLSAKQIRTCEDIAERFGDAEYHYLVCVPERKRGHVVASGEERPASNERESTDEAAPERVGGVALTRADGDSGNLTYWIARDHRGQGYVTEATELLLDFVFRECGFHKVTANTYVSNGPSVRTLESLGFEREGRLREAGLVDGEFEDMFQYSLLRREWLEG
jgi:RimJ/RimL family protein N-acetyltransferase